MGTEKEFARKLIQKGGRYWNNYGKERVYFDALKIMEIAGVDLSYFNTGNISSATYEDNTMSNGQANTIQEKLEKGNIYYDLQIQQFVWTKPKERHHKLVSNIFEQFLENIN